MPIALCASLLLLASGDDPADLLRRIEQQRAQWRALRVEWNREDAHRPGVPWYHTSVCNQQQQIFVQRGDENGSFAIRSAGDKPGHAYGPFYSLSGPEDKLWQRIENQFSAEIWDREPGANDAVTNVRAFGLSYVPASGELADVLWNDGPRAKPRKYRLGKDGTYDRLTAETERGTITWTLDPASGGLPVRVTLEKDGVVLSESRSTLKRFGDVWFPERVEFYNRRLGKDAEPLQVVSVLSLEIDPPDVPAHFTEADIGIDAGFHISRSDKEGKVVETGVWDGQKVIPFEEYQERMRAGTFQEGPSYLRNLAVVRAGRGGVRPADTSEDAAESSKPRRRTDRTRLIGEWEAYTRAFILRYGLNGEQSQQAWNILKRCEDQAQEHLSKHKSEFEEIERAVSATAGGSGATPSAAAGSETNAAREKLLARLDKLLEPLDDIFEKRLKPDLEKLPTRAQRKRAEAGAAAATQAARP